MTRLSSLDEIARLYAERGGLAYGEGVTQMEHALQCGALARAHGPGLTVAALLHDIGHLFSTEEQAALADDRHQIAGAQVLAGLFGAAICEPIALHVAAKRYLCFCEPGYFEALSAASQASLKLQGGTFDVAQARAFEQRPYWRDAVVLRRFDDVGKREDASGLSFEDFMPVMREVLLVSAK
jgi:phosphonate degradation associated HDIG domain protein